MKSKQYLDAKLITCSNVIFTTEPDRYYLHFLITRVTSIIKEKKIFAIIKLSCNVTYRLEILENIKNTFLDY